MYESGMADLLVDGCRGFHVCYVRDEIAVPEEFDPTTGKIKSSIRPRHRFKIVFDARGPRDEMKVGAP